MNFDTPLELPCGAKLSNRLAKSGMSEHLADVNHLPSVHLENLYRRWSQGGSGLLITGNVMIDPRSMTASRNVVLCDGVDLEHFKRWASAGTENGNQFWLQLNHPGRQTPRNINPSPVSASATDPVDLLRSVKAFASARAMNEQEIEEVIQRFCISAAMVKAAGFTGVQIHAAHGYLINQFLSPMINKRNDNWGGELVNRARLLRTVLQRVREKVGSNYPVAVKLNSADFQRGGLCEDETMQVIKWISEENVDLIEISGGNYESQAMFDPAITESTRTREAYFLDFARQARQISSIPLMVTGGFRTASVMREVLESGSLDVIGMARPLAAEPDLSRKIINGTSQGSSYKLHSYGIKKLDFLSESGWCMAQFNRMARGKEPLLEMSAWRSLFEQLGYSITDTISSMLQR